MIIRSATAIAAISLAATAYAQDANPPPVLQAVEQAPAPSAVLPANTQINLTVNDEITTKGKKFSEGDTFSLSVSQPVMLGNYVVIPRGARGMGRITWLTSKGAFGKSGKMDIALEYVEVGNTRVPIEGSYRQEGEGNTVATVGGVVLAGVFAGFITGKSARIPEGRELTAHTKTDLPVALPAGASLAAPGLAATAAAPVAATEPAPTTEAEPQL